MPENTEPSSIPTTVTAKISSEPATAEEEIGIAEIEAKCSDLIKQLKYPTDDVVGSWRLLRFIRNSKGDIKKAAKNYGKFLNHRLAKDSLIEDLAHEVRGLSDEDFVAWFRKRRNHYVPFCPYAGTSEDGTMYFLIRQGATDIDKFISNRPLKLPLLDDLFLMLQCNEWCMWKLNELCKQRQKMCYMIKIMDFGGLAVNPFKNSKFRDYMKIASTFFGLDYCDGDSKFVFVETPTIFNIIYPVMKLFMTSRQKTKMMVLDNPSKLVDYAPIAILPKKFGGSETCNAHEFLYTERNEAVAEQQLHDRVALRKQHLERYPKDLKEMAQIYN